MTLTISKYYTRLFAVTLLSFLTLTATGPACAQGGDTNTLASPAVQPQQPTAVQPENPADIEDEAAFDPSIVDENYFDDQFLIQGFSDRYLEEDLDTLLAMIQDETIPDIKAAGAVRALREKYALNIFNKDKAAAERVLLKTYNRSDSAFLHVELMQTLVLMDRYKYYATFVPRLLLKLDHYNDAINLSAFNGMNNIIVHGNNRAREARIVFNTLRKMLFLKKRRLANVTEPDERLKQKIEILKWSIKILGAQELDRLPKEVLNLL